VMVQVGPQPRQCFRFNKDHVDYMQDYCFRKHEVWIRRGSTSDLAAPEEIKRLLEGKAAIAPAPVENNIDYMRLHKKEIWPALRKDAYSHGFRTVIPMHPGHPFRSIPDSHSD